MQSTVTIVLAKAQVQCKRSSLTATKTMHQLAASTHTLPTYTDDTVLIQYRQYVIVMSYSAM